jgi:hypothetical protein
MGPMPPEFILVQKQAQQVIYEKQGLLRDLKAPCT